jgi:Undecaprenyl-phosphate glucose phosphotransferase
MSLASLGEYERSADHAGAFRLVLPFKFIEPTVILFEFLVVLLASLFGGIGYHLVFFGSVGDIRTFVGVGLLVFVNVSAISAARGNYRPNSLLNFPRQVREVTLGWTFVCLMLLVVAFSFKITEEYSRGTSLAFFVFGWSAVVAWRKILLVAEEEQLASSKMLSELRRCGYKPVKIFKIKASELEAGGIPPTLQATLDQVIETSRNGQTVDLYLLVSWSRRRCIEDILAVLRVLPVPVHLLPDEDVTRFLSSRVVNIGAAWTAELKRAPLDLGEQALKRSCDLLLSGVGLVLLAPLMLITALAIKLDSKGPVLFSQTRNGFNGRSFRIFKFRTMCVLEDGPVIRQAIQDDPRVTRLGRWLRRTSIDELPQLFNVILGEMSLVGPRPHATAHNTEYEKLVADYAFRYHMKPGITGWAQVSGYRGETQKVELMAKRIEFDLWYIRNWSFWLDIRILLKTLILEFHQSSRPY